MAEQVNQNVMLIHLFKTSNSGSVNPNFSIYYLIDSAGFRYKITFKLVRLHIPHALQGPLDHHMGNGPHIGDILARIVFK